MQRSINHLSISLFLAILLTLSVNPVFSQSPSPPNDYIAMVNGTAVTRAAYNQEILALRAHFSQGGKQIDEPRFEKMKKEVLTELINSELLYQDSLKKGIIITEDALEKDLASIKRQYRSEAAFKKDLAEMNMSVDEMKENLKKSMAVDALIARYVTHEVLVTEKELKEFYDNHPDLYESEEYRKASHILIKYDTTKGPSDKKRALRKIKDIEKKLNQGMDFTKLATQYSECPSRDNGGDLGHFSRGEMVKPFEEAVFSLTLEKVSPIVETQFGFHLIKLTDIMQDPPIAFDTAKFDIRKKLSWEKSKIIIDKHLLNLRKSAKIETFSR